MKDRKLFIETLEICNNLMANCIETMKELNKELDQTNGEYRKMAEYAMKQKADNLSLEQKLTNILNGIGVNK